MRTTASVLRRFARDRSGLAAIELAIVAPVLLLCTLGVADLGRFALDKTWVTYAASAGAEYAVAHASTTFDASAITNAAQSAAASGISVSPTPSEYYGCATSTGVVTAINGTTVTTSTVCPSSTSTGGQAGQYVSVTAATPFVALFGAAGISYPSTITTTAVVRIQ